MARSSELPTDTAALDRDNLTIETLDALIEIRDTLDNIRDEIAWWINNHRHDQWLPAQPIATIAEFSPMPTSAPPVPASSASNQPPPSEHDPVPTAQRQATTAPADGHDETQFCCEAPDLQWTGDPQFPGVACMNCGYIVADCGSVVMQPSPEADPDPQPKEQQRGLFADG